MRDGVVDPERLTFTANHVERARKVARRGSAEVDAAVGGLLRDLFGPGTVYRCPDMAGCARP